ncbi:unnamed protein product [Scytosiphon promiscuus]
MGTAVPWDDLGVTSLVQSRTFGAKLPVILCAPHGGNAVDGDQSETLLERPPVSPSRRSGGGGRSISLVADVGTSQLLEEIDQKLARKCCVNAGIFVTATDAPAAVVARFHRKYVDANRSQGDDEAVAVHPSSTRARDVHDYYHRTIETAVRLLGFRFTKQSPLPSQRSISETLRCESDVRHTHAATRHSSEPPPAFMPSASDSNGKTADLQKLERPKTGFLWHLRRNLGAEDETTQGQDGAGGTERHQHERRLGSNGEGNEWVDRSGPAKEEEGGLTKQNDEVRVLPLPGENEVPGYTGGYTVQRHGVLARTAVCQEPPTAVAEKVEGSQEGRTGSGSTTVAVDAIQLEFGSRLRRTPEARAVTAEAVASAVYHHLQEQQKQPPKKKLK